MMTARTAEAVIDLLARSSSMGTLDITGGAPELNELPMLVERSRTRTPRYRAMQSAVILERGMGWLVDFYRRSRVELHLLAPVLPPEMSTSSAATAFLPGASRRSGC